MAKTDSFEQCSCHFLSPHVQHSVQTRLGTNTFYVHKATGMLGLHVHKNTDMLGSHCHQSQQKVAAQLQSANDDTDKCVAKWQTHTGRHTTKYANKTTNTLLVGQIVRRYYSTSNAQTQRATSLFSRQYWVVRSRLWSVCHLSVCNVLYCG